MTTTSTMPAVTYLGPLQLEWRDIPVPTLASTQAALVRPLAVASCDLDGALICGKAPLPGPFVLGHEVVGEIIDIGDTVTGVTMGDIVVVPFQISCGACGPCSRSKTAHCTNARKGVGPSMYGLGGAGGGFGGALTDVLHVPYADAMLVPLPAGIDPVTVASISDNIADAWRTVGPPLLERPGAAVLILNGGPSGSIGLYAALLADTLGASRVDYLDTSPARCEHAASLGAAATHLTSWGRRTGKYPIVVECTQRREGLAQALRSTEPGGACTSTSIFYDDTTPVPMRDMYFQGVSLRCGLVDSRPAIPKVLALLDTGHIDLARITTQVASWADAVPALLDYTTKLVIHRAPTGREPNSDG